MEKAEFEKIVASCPKAYAALIEYFVEKDRQEQLIKNESSNFTVDRMIRLMFLSGASPRFLFDFFDQKNVLISIILDAPSKWIYRVHTIADQLLLSDFGIKSSRTEGEEAAFILAFKLLEQQIK